MGLFFFLIIAGGIVYLLFLGKSHEGSNPEALTENDDFTGNSIRSYFFLEEIVDSGGGEHRSKNQGFVRSEPMEDDYFEEDGDYFEDEFFE